MTLDRGTLPARSPRPLMVACNTGNPGPDGHKYISGSQVIIVVGMEIKFTVGIPVLHLFAEGIGFIGVQDAEGIGQHNPVHRKFFQGICHKKNIIRWNSACRLTSLRGIR